MLHRSFGNLDEVIEDRSPFINSNNEYEHKIGIVESVDSKTFIVKVRDSQSGQRGIKCVVLSEHLSALDKSGSPTLPVPETKVLYILNGGNLGIILGNLITGLADPKRKLKDGVNGNSGFENFIDTGSPREGDIPSDFGWGPGDRGWVNERGKIKLTTAGIIILKSAPFCFQYMLPAKQARLSQFLNDEERGVGYIRRRRTFFSMLAASGCNANYKMEQIEDIPSAPQTVLREEKGFCDRETAVASLNHYNELDISGHLLTSILGSLEIMKARAIRRTIIAKTKKEQGIRVLYSPVYKKEERIDGTVIEQCGHLPGAPFYNLEVVKSPLGYMHIIGRMQQVPKFILKFDPILGSVEIHGDIVALSAKTAISFTAPLVQVVGAMTIAAPTLDLVAATAVNIAAPNVNINAGTLANIAAPTINVTGATIATIQAATVNLGAVSLMNINAPAISSMPTPAVLVAPVAPVVPIPPVMPPIPIPMMIDADNTPLDEIPLD